MREDYTECVQLHRRELTKTFVEPRNQGKYASLRFDKLLLTGTRSSTTTQTVQSNGLVVRDHVVVVAGTADRSDWALVAGMMTQVHVPLRVKITTSVVPHLRVGV